MTVYTPATSKQDAEDHTLAGKGFSSRSQAVRMRACLNRNRMSPTQEYKLYRVEITAREEERVNGE